MLQCVDLGKEYLLSKIDNGLCLEFHQLRHGPSWAWVTACVGSALSEFGFVPRDIVEAVLSLQCSNGGWSYNQNVPADADTTLRVMQLLSKIGFTNHAVIADAEKFVLHHQLSDGGFTTYLPETVREMGYSSCAGWCSSHSCVTSLAINQINDVTSVRRAKNYLLQNGPNAYWWRTPYYVRYELGCPNGDVETKDPVETSLILLLSSKLGIYNPKLIEVLISMQHRDGSMPASFQFRIPRPHQTIRDICGDEEVVSDGQGIFSTCATIVAIERQKHFA